MSNAYSVNIGLNHVDPVHYQGWDGKLFACVEDAIDINGIAKSLKYKTCTLLLNENASRKKVISRISALAGKLKAGDLFLLSYSGHGGQVPDIHFDETDRMDETWCLYDGQMLDDELKQLWLKFRPGVHIIVLSDSCHSGTVTRMPVAPGANNGNGNRLARSMPWEVARRTYKANQMFYNELMETDQNKFASGDIKATVRLISGCRDDQTSADGEDNGLFTGMLLRVWNSGNFSGNWVRFHKSILRLMPPEQTPQHNVIGKSDPSWNAMRPFDF